MKVIAVIPIIPIIPIINGCLRMKYNNLLSFAETTLMENKIKALLKLPEYNVFVVNRNYRHLQECIYKCYALN